MFSDPVSFNGGTRVEVIAVLANCGRDTDRARRALVTWIRHKQTKGRSTEHILAKLRDIESKFIRDKTLHCAFRDARAETCLPRAPDLPLPSSLRRKSNPQSPEYAPTPATDGRNSFSSSLEIPATSTQPTSPPISPLHLSRDSSQMAESLPGNSGTAQRASLPQNVSRVSHLGSPRIQIPHQSIGPAPNSPITSSPEEPDRHLRYRVMSQPVGLTYRSNGLITPVSPGSPEFLRSPLSHDRRPSSHSLASPPPSIRVPIPRSRSQRNVPHSPPTSSSDESDFRPRRYRPMSQPVGPISQPFGHMSPSRRRVTPPSSGPPDVPLPPIPSDDQGMESDHFKKTPPAEQPPTPVRSMILHTSTPVRPLPIQPIPSPVPGSDESESHEAIGEDSLRQNWQGSTGDLPSDIVIRKDSPVYAFHDDYATGIGPPPPYVDPFGTHSPPDMPMVGDSLVTAINRCGGSPELRLAVSKCIEFHREYEPPYWQSRLQACGLDAETARLLVDEMSKQVDWSTSFRRST